MRCSMVPSVLSLGRGVNQSLYVIRPMPKIGRTAKAAESDHEKTNKTTAVFLPSLTSGFMAKTILRNLSSMEIPEPNTCEATAHVRIGPIMLASLLILFSKASFPLSFPCSWSRRCLMYIWAELNLANRILTKAMSASHTATFRSKRTARSFLRDLLNMIKTTTAMFTSSATEPVAYRAKDDFLVTSYSDVVWGRKSWSIQHTSSARHVGQNPNLIKSSALPYGVSSCHHQSRGELPNERPLQHEELTSSDVILHREQSWQYCDRRTPSTVVRLLSCSNCLLGSQSPFPVTSNFLSPCSSLVGFTFQSRRSLKDKFLECMHTWTTD